MLGFKEGLCVFINCFLGLACGGFFFYLGWMGRGICCFVYSVLRIAAKTSEKNEKKRSEFEFRGLIRKGIEKVWHEKAIFLESGASP